MSEIAACTPTWRRRVSSYHDGGLPSGERALVESHVRECAACQQLLSSYDRIYRDLRNLPGFEGLLTITKPGTRRGLGGNSRPTFTWPGKNTSSSVGPWRDGAHRGGGGPIVVTLLVLVALALMVGRVTNFIGPQAQSSANPNFLGSPTFGATTNNGVPCVNAGQTVSYPYVYSDSGGHIYHGVGCSPTHLLTTVTVKDVQFDAFSPDGKQVLASSPALPTRQAGQRTHLYVLTVANGAWNEVNLSTDNGKTTYSADEAVWQNAGTVILRSGTTLVQADLTKNTLTPLGVTATHIEVRGSALFYSTVAGGHATLHRRTLQGQSTDEVLLSLGAGVATCAKPTCWQTIPWDISVDGKLIAYPTPVPAAPPTTTALATIVLQNLQTSARTTLGSVGLNAAPTTLSISPNMRYVALIGEQAATNQLQLFSVEGRTVLTDNLAGACVWRPDSAALVAMPYVASTTTTARLVNVLAGTASTLAPQTTNYLWGY